MKLGIYEVERQPWVLKFEGFSTEKSTGVGIVIISPKGIKLPYISTLSSSAPTIKLNMRLQ